MESEFVSCFEATSQGVWLKSFISGLRVMDYISRPLRIFCDNSTAMFLAKNNKSESRSKHIDIKYLAIREHVKQKQVVTEHISTELMIVDPLTKGMPTHEIQESCRQNGDCFLFVIVYIHLVHEILIHTIIFSFSCALNSFENVYFIWT